MNNLFKKITTFLREAKIEFKKVNWPTKQETIKYTLIVIGISLVVMILLGSLDLVLSWFISKII